MLIGSLAIPVRVRFIEGRLASDRQRSCGYFQIRLYELTLSCQSLQTVAASSACKSPTLRGGPVYPRLPIHPKGAALTRRRKKAVRIRRFEKKMAFVKIKQALIPHFSKFQRQPAALHTEIIRKLLS